MGRRLRFAVVGQLAHAPIAIAPRAEGTTTLSDAPMQASAAALPERIEVQLQSYLARHPSLTWDDALAQIIGGQNGRDVVG